MKKLTKIISGLFGKKSADREPVLKSDVLGKTTFDHWIGVKGEVRIIRPDNKTDYSLAELHRWVGGNVETVSLGDGWLMIVREDGKLRNMPMNVTATRLFREKVPHNYDFIVGDAMVIHSERLK